MKTSQFYKPADKERRGCRGKPHHGPGGLSAALRQLVSPASPSPSRTGDLEAGKERTPQPGRSHQTGLPKNSKYLEKTLAKKPERKQKE